jgi:hypothetical protein
MFWPYYKKKQYQLTGQNMFGFMVDLPLAGNLCRRIVELCLLCQKQPFFNNVNRVE